MFVHHHLAARKAQPFDDCLNAQLTGIPQTFCWSATNSVACRSDTQVLEAVRLWKKRLGACRCIRNSLRHSTLVNPNVDEASCCLLTPILVEIRTYTFAGGLGGLNGIRIGEAKNPGPGNISQQMTFVVLNPTSLSERQQDIVNLDADCISLAETSATSTIQKEFSNFTRPTKYNVVWGPPVGHQKTPANPFQVERARRGEALGTASLHSTPNRQPRLALPQWLTDTLRVSQRIVHYRLGTSRFSLSLHTSMRVEQQRLRAKVTYYSPKSTNTAQQPCPS